MLSLLTIWADIYAIQTAYRQDQGYWLLGLETDYSGFLEDAQRDNIVCSRWCKRKIATPADYK